MERTLSHTGWSPSRSLSLLAIAVAPGIVDGCAGPSGGTGTPTPTGRAAEWVPLVTGAFTRVYAPAMMRYLNDHTLVRGPDGMWHLYGITDDTAGTPQDEHIFLHATAPSLFGPWTDQADALAADRSLDEVVLWSPHVVEPTVGHWTMYYWGGWTAATPNPANGLRRADSTDLTTWTRLETTVNPALRPPGGRDPMALKIGDVWYLYSVGCDATNHGQILVTTNTDLDHAGGWTPAVPVITDPVPSFSWGDLESPFVVPYDGHYYLFLTRTGAAEIDYVRTLVFRSSDPTVFTWDPITQIDAHAAEIVVDHGSYYITSAGWTSSLGEDNRGLDLAPLDWVSVTSSHAP